jgi:hypothetical protein
LLSWLSPHALKDLIGAVGVIVGLESMGLLLPGETVLVIAAL